MIKFFLLFILFSSLNSIEEIEYILNRVFLGRFIDRFSVKFNRLKGVTAELEEGPKIDIGEKVGKGNKIYNLTTEELGLPSIKELFKQFNKIKFPNETDWVDHQLFDVPIWELIVDGKIYRSNVGTEFLDKFNELVRFGKIHDYCKERY